MGVQSGSPQRTKRDDELAADWHELMNRYHRITCQLDRELMSQHQLTVSEFEVLQQLAQAPDGALKMHELGENVHLSQSALSRLVARLEHDGLVERGMCNDDRRSVWATLTPAGTARYKQAKPTHRAILRESAMGCIAQSEQTFSNVRG